MLGLLWMAVAGVASFISGTKEANYNARARENYDRRTGTYYDRRGRTVDVETGEFVQIKTLKGGDIVVMGGRGYGEVWRNISEMERWEKFEKEKNNPDRTATVMRWDEPHYVRDYETGRLFVEKKLIGNLGKPGRVLDVYMDVGTEKIVRMTDLQKESNDENRAGIGYFAQKPFSDEEINWLIDGANKGEVWIRPA